MLNNLLREELQHKVLKFSLILVAVTIPLHNNLNSYAIVFFGSTVGLVSMRKLLGFRYPAIFYISFSYFLWLALTFLWDTSGGFTFKNLEPYASFAVLPLALWLVPRLSAKSIWHICFAFILSITVISLICLVMSYLEYRQSGDSRVFYYHYLSQQMQLNAIFLSSYCVSGIAWFIYFGFIHTPPVKMPGRVWIFAWCFYLFIFVFLLSSKMVILLLLAYILFFMIYLGRRSRKFKAALIFFLLIGAVAAFAFDNFYYLKWRLSVTEFKEYEGPQDDQNGLATRVLMWRSAAELVSERPVGGYGLRGASIALIKKYEEKKFLLGAGQRYHAHNQYLQSALMAGLVGLGLFLAFVVVVFRKAILFRSIPLILFTLYFMIVCLVESTLEVQQELVFYVFFMLLFYFHLLPRPARKFIAS